MAFDWQSMNKRREGIEERVAEWNEVIETGKQKTKKLKKEMQKIEEEQEVIKKKKAEVSSAFLSSSVDGDQC